MHYFYLNEELAWQPEGEEKTEQGYTNAEKDKTEFGSRSIASGLKMRNGTAVWALCNVALNFLATVKTVDV